MANPLLAPVLGFLGRRSYPRLFVITATLFVIDLMIPLDDLFPPYFLDELMLGLGTLWLANWKKRKDPQPVPDAGPGRVIEGESRR